MPAGHPHLTIRALAALGAAGLLTLLTGGAVTAQDEPDSSEADSTSLVLTPAQQEGPYYPVEIPADHDDDLTVIEGADGPAAGETLVLEGRLLDVEGSPVEGATVEIWQTDAGGVYLHPADPSFADRDTAFQGFGAAETGADGDWAFRTILPEIYGGRPRHIHAKVKVDGQTVLTTQIYFSGGDIPSDGAVATSGTELDALLVEAYREAGLDDAEVLTARHLLVVP